MYSTTAYILGPTKPGSVPDNVLDVIKHSLLLRRDVYVAM